jgi:glycosyltransferase involved in cell wall biosynthesis
MKIAYLLGSLNRGGTETLLLDVFRCAKNQDLNAIGIYRKSGVLEKDFLASSVPVHKVSTGKGIVRYIFRLRQLLLENNVTVVHAQQPIDALYAWLACAGTPIKLLLTLHGFDFSENKAGPRILRFIIRRTDTNIYVSDTQRHYYQEKYRLKPGKQKVVYNGISFDKLDSPQSRTPGKDTALREELQLAFSTLLIGTVGNFNAVRDQLTICRFLNLLKELEIDCHFIFAGKRIESSGYLYDDCVEYCAQNNLDKSVTFLGVRHDVPGILSELDAFIYSTNHDTFGIAVVEAMATGIPVFVNNWGVMSEITDNGKYATFYKTKDEQDLLRHFLLFLQNKAQYQARAKEASLFVREKYSIERHIEKLKNVYELVINE